jgi:hypothetical protein
MRRYLYHRIYNDSTNKTIFSDHSTEAGYHYSTYGEYNWDLHGYKLQGYTFHYYFRISFWAEGYTNPSSKTRRFYAPPYTSAQYVCGSQYGCEF